MFDLGHSTAYKEMEKLLNDIQINLENNYKDLAIDARKTAEERIAQMKADAELNDKEYKRLKERLDSYTQRMVGYHH